MLRLPHFEELIVAPTRHTVPWPGEQRYATLHRRRRRGYGLSMITADDHWPATLQRVVATLDFKVADPRAIAPVMAIEMRQDIHSLPALIQTAVQATIEIDHWIATERMEIPVNREAILARKQLARAIAADPPGSAQSPFTAGYDAAYRLRLEQLVWSAIADHPRRRLEELASARAG